MFKHALWLLVLLFPLNLSAKTSWTRVNGEEGEDNTVLALFALDGSTAWAIGANSSGGNTQIKGYKMSGGSSFGSMALPVGSGTMVMFTDIVFQDANTGYISGMDISMPFKLDFATNILWRTTNGGGSWEVVDDTLEEMLVHMDLFPTGELFAITTKAFYTLSGGALVEGGAISVGDLSLNKVQMLTTQVGYVVGGQGIDEEDTSKTPGHGFVYKTSDGGASFAPLAQDLPFNVTTVWFINEDIGYIGGSDGTRAYLRITTDGGQSWSDQTLPNHPELTIDIELPFKFTQTIDAAPPTSLSDIRFFDCERGVALGMLCTGSCDTPSEASYLTVFMRTYDGGIIWEMDPDYEAVMDGWGQMDMMPKVVSGMSSMAFPDPNNGFIGGQNLMILKYSADNPEEVPAAGIPDCSGGSNTNNANNGTNNNPGDDPGFSDGGSDDGCGCAVVGRTGTTASLSLLLMALALGLVLRRRTL